MSRPRRLGGRVARWMGAENERLADCIGEDTEGAQSNSRSNHCPAAGLITRPAPRVLDPAPTRGRTAQAPRTCLATLNGPRAPKGGRSKARPLPSSATIACSKPCRSDWSCPRLRHHRQPRRHGLEHRAPLARPSTRQRQHRDLRRMRACRRQGQGRKPPSAA